MVKITTAWGLQKVVVGLNNGVVGFTEFSCKKMYGLLFGQQKSGRNKLKDWTYQRVVV